MEPNIAPILISEESNDPYESLPTNCVKTHMLAGAAAGVMEHCIMYPLDSVKVSYLLLCRIVKHINHFSTFNKLQTSIYCLYSLDILLLLPDHFFSRLECKA